MVIESLKAIMQKVVFKRDFLKTLLTHCIVRGTELNEKNVIMLNRYYRVFSEVDFLSDC